MGNPLVEALNQIESALPGVGQSNDVRTRCIRMERMTTSDSASVNEFNRNLRHSTDTHTNTMMSTIAQTALSIMHFHRF